MAITESSLAILLHDCRKWIYATCYRHGIRDLNDIDDIQQSVLFRVFVEHRKGYNASVWKAVIVAMTKHSIWDFAQKSKHEQSRRVCIGSLDQIATHESQYVDEQIDAKTIINKLTDEMNPSELRYLHFWMNGFSARKASIDLGITIQAYKASLYRLMKKMKKTIRKMQL